MKKYQNKNISVAALTQGINVPSTRFRWLQYEKYLVNESFTVKTFNSLHTAYAPSSLVDRMKWFPNACLDSFIRVLNSNKYNIRFLQRNLIAKTYTAELFLKSPVIFDVDDSIFLGKMGWTSNKISSKSQLTICGNNFLANHFSSFSKVIVLPTPVDTEKFLPKNSFSNNTITIGWVGSSSGFKYLYKIQKAIDFVLQHRSNVYFKVISDSKPNFESIKSENKIIFEKFSEAFEVEQLHTIDIGIMPLFDDLWSRGKCSFKMLTYMSIGIPVVVSPVGMNSEILEKASLGFSAKNISEWIETLTLLIDESYMRKKMGLLGRDICEKYYSLNVCAPILSSILQQYSE